MTASPRDLTALPAMCTLEEAAPIFRCSRWTLARAAERHEIRTVRLGRRILVPRAEIERLLGLENSEGPAATAEPIATADVPRRQEEVRHGRG